MIHFERNYDNRLSNENPRMVVFKKKFHEFLVFHGNSARVHRTQNIVTKNDRHRTVNTIHTEQPSQPTCYNGEEHLSLRTNYFIGPSCSRQRIVMSQRLHVLYHRIRGRWLLSLLYLEWR